MASKDVSYLTSVPINPGPSGNSPPESVINPPLPPLGLKVADQWVAGDFEVGYVRRMKPIIMLGPRKFHTKKIDFENFIVSST